MGKEAVPQSMDVFQKGIRETCEFPKQETEILGYNAAAYSPLPPSTTA